MNFLSYHYSNDAGELIQTLLQTCQTRVIFGFKNGYYWGTAGKYRPTTKTKTLRYLEEIPRSKGKTKKIVMCYKAKTQLEGSRETRRNSNRVKTRCSKCLRLVCVNFLHNFINCVKFY